MTTHPRTRVGSTLDRNAGGVEGAGRFDVMWTFADRVVAESATEVAPVVIDRQGRPTPGKDGTLLLSHGRASSYRSLKPLRRLSLQLVKSCRPGRPVHT